MRGNILITSRKGFAAESVLIPARKVHVGGFTPHEAREALTLPYHEAYLENDAVLADIMQDVTSIVEDLEYSPLAIELARAHMPPKLHRESLRQFRESLKVSRDALEVSADPTSTAQVDAILVMVHLSLSRIERLSHLPETTLHPHLLLSFLARFPFASVEEELFHLA